MVVALSGLLGILLIASLTRLKSPNVMCGLISGFVLILLWIDLQNSRISLGALGAYIVSMLMCWSSCHGMFIMMALPETMVLHLISSVFISFLFSTSATPLALWVSGSGEKIRSSVLSKRDLNW